MELRFDIAFPGEKAAGLNSYTETVTVTVESGDPGGEPGEFAEYMREALAQWFDGAGVALGKKRPPAPAHSCDIPGCAVCDPTYGL